MCKLQLEISRVVTGFVHIQTNPYYSYDAHKMVTNAKSIMLHCTSCDFTYVCTGIIQLFKHLDSEFDTKRVCIKIPGSWEGFKACGILQSQGIETLGTTLFTIEQAALAGELKCHYIAPYVNELRVHFDPGYFSSPNPPTPISY